MDDSGRHDVSGEEGILMMSFDRRLEFHERLVAMDDEQLQDLADAVDYEWQFALDLRGADTDGLEVLREDILTRSRMIATEQRHRSDGTRQAERELAEKRKGRDGG